MENTDNNISQKTIGFSSGFDENVFYNQNPNNSFTVFNVNNTDNLFAMGSTITFQSSNLYGSLNSLPNQTQVVTIFIIELNLLVLSVKGPVIYYCNVFKLYKKEVSLLLLSNTKTKEFSL